MVFALIHPKNKIYPSTKSELLLIFKFFNFSFLTLPAFPNHTKIATVPFKGKVLNVLTDNFQWRNFRISGDKLYVNKNIAADFEKLKREFDKFCELELRKIVEAGINKLKYKKIRTELNYTDGQKTFLKKVSISVQEYLKMLNYSPKIEIKIGVYDKEWGINEINTKRKNFILYFNLNLIKYDNGGHIEYVVAHELAHVFHRNHDTLFNKTLENLYSRKRQSENFFTYGIQDVFVQRKSSQTFFVLLIIIVVILVLYWIYSLVGNIFGGTNSLQF